MPKTNDLEEIEGFLDTGLEPRLWSPTVLSLIDEIRELRAEVARLREGPSASSRPGDTLWIEKAAKAIGKQFAIVDENKHWSIDIEQIIREHMPDIDENRWMEARNAGAESLAKTLLSDTGGGSMGNESCNALRNELLSLRAGRQTMQDAVGRIRGLCMEFGAFGISQRPSLSNKERLLAIADSLDAAAGSVEERSVCKVCGGKGWHTAGGNDPMECGACNWGSVESLSEEDQSGKAINCKMYCGACGAQQSSVNVKACELCGESGGVFYVPQ